MTMWPNQSPEPSALVAARSTLVGPKRLTSPRLPTTDKSFIA